MEWVEKTGRSVEEAKERALGELGVAESDAELVVLAEPKTGLFGRVRGEARVRARVRPAEPRPKRQRRQRDRSRTERSENGSSGARGGSARAESSSRANAGGGASSTSGPSRSGESRSGTSRRRRRGGTGGGGNRPGGGLDGVEERSSGTGRSRASDDGPAKEENTVADGITLQEQAEVAKEFLEGLLDRYGLSATVEIRELDDETVELAASGEGLGVLVGPKGATIAALQDVTRTVVQRRFPNRTDRILVDVAGYRERRVAALQRFTEQVAGEVLESGTERALEPMTPADRKVVHDTAVGIEGVSSSSQGVEPHRYVVISPEP